MQKVVLVLWPSFWVAVLAEVLFFTLIDPQELYLFGRIVDFPPIATYSLGFLGFWAICAASSLATLFYQRGPEQINPAHKGRHAHLQ